MLVTVQTLKDEQNAKLNILDKKIAELNDQLVQKEKAAKCLEREKIVLEHEHGIQLGKLKF
jgi:hypothetical protein